MNNYKPCRQCGEIKPMEQFRPYYGGRKGVYRTCKTCEKINSREKYLSSKASLVVSEGQELSKIHELWLVQSEAGLQPPRTPANVTSLTNLDEMIDKYKAIADVQTNEHAPHELLKWLQEPLTGVPEYYLEAVYEDLKNTYRPQLKIDNLVPVYDDTYRDTLSKVLARFYQYEDDYYEGD